MAKKTPLIGKNIQRRSADVCWLFRFNVAGETYNGETHTRDRKEAEAFAAARKAEVLGQAKKNATLGLTPMTFGQACDAWWNEQGRHNVKDLGAQVTWLREQVGEKTLLQDLRATHVIAVREARRDTERYCAVNGTRKITSSTVNGTLILFRSIVNHAHLHHSAPVAPIAWSKLHIKIDQHEIRVLSEDELRAIIGALRPDLHDVIWFALASGKRIDEILSLTWEQIDWNVAHPTMRLRTKGGKQVIDPLRGTELDILRRQLAHQGAGVKKTDRVFTFIAQRTQTYLHRDTKAVLCHHVRGQRYPLDYGLLRPMFDKVVKELGIDGVTIHVLRHTAATWMLRAGEPIESVSRALNHASIAITLKHYAKVTSVEVGAAKDKLAEKVAAELQQASRPRLELVKNQ